jgi:hypothetical protein
MLVYPANTSVTISPIINYGAGAAGSAPFKYSCCVDANLVGISVTSAVC